MDSLAVAALVSQDAMSRTALSALPDAPVLPERQRPSRSPRLRRPRGLLAFALHRTADAIAPRTCSAAA